MEFHDRGDENHGLLIGVSQRPTELPVTNPCRSGETYDRCKFEVRADGSRLLYLTDTSAEVEWDRATFLATNGSFVMVRENLEGDDSQPTGEWAYTLADSLPLAENLLNGTSADCDPRHGSAERVISRPIAGQGSVMPGTGSGAS